MIDHISIKVRDHAAAVKFYAAALQPLGYKVMMEFPGATGLGATMPDLWLIQSEQTAPTHVAFSADRKTVDAFHRAGIEAGGKDNGAPGLRAEYHPTYYGAFILDPEGNNIEAVCHAPEGAPKKRAAAKKPAAKKAAKKRAPAAKKGKRAPAKRAAKRK
jgi:catechol 2,3-dioxygenase-like lactoylglutathione lyase family enzyme